MSYEGLGVKRQKVDVSSNTMTRSSNRCVALTPLEPPKTPRAAPTATPSASLHRSVDGETIDDAGASDFQVEWRRTLLRRSKKRWWARASATPRRPRCRCRGAPAPQAEGKTASFAITINDIKERCCLPPTTVRQGRGEFETLAALKEDIKKKLETQAKEQSDNQLAEQLVLELVKANPVPVPPSLVERQMRLTEQEILSRARSQGQRVTGLGDELRGKLVEDSEIKVRAGLLMAEIAKKEGIQIGNEEIENGLKELAEQTVKTLQAPRPVQDQQKREMLIGMISENKVRHHRGQGQDRRELTAGALGRGRG